VGPKELRGSFSALSLGLIWGPVSELEERWNTGQPLKKRARRCFDSEVERNVRERQSLAAWTEENKKIYLGTAQPSVGDEKKSGH